MGSTEGPASWPLPLPVWEHGATRALGCRGDAGPSRAAEAGNKAAAHARAAADLPFILLQDCSQDLDEERRGQATDKTQL